MIVCHHESKENNHPDIRRFFDGSIHERDLVLGHGESS